MRNNLRIMQNYSMKIIDFDDSFSFNIASTLIELGLDCQVINYLDLKYENINCSENKVYLLGPGPGHPIDYRNVIAPFLNKTFGVGNNFFMGVCLGHQMLLDFLGYEIGKKIQPTHGQARSIVLPNWKDYFLDKYIGRDILIQEYNSLYVKKNINNMMMNIDYYNLGEEILMAKCKNFISFQFHPESIGTSDPHIFFKFLKRGFI
jgi:anthranilate/para-aminobenzoate synthase component II